MTAVLAEMPVRPGYTPGSYVDIAGLIALGPIAPPTPTIGCRTDNIGLFYEKSVNLMFADSESGKTMICLCIAADTLFQNGSVLFIDLDHNGAASIVSRLRAMGVSADTLANTELFRFAEPESPDDMAKIIADAEIWNPVFVIIDSLGELLPMYGANSNSPDDFTRVHTTAIKPFAAAGAGVALIDHTAKGQASAAYGSTGTAAKKRAISGASFRVHVTEQFTPGKGGKAELLIHKDRHGGLRAHSPVGEKEPLGAKFVMTDTDGALNWAFYAPDHGERSSAGKPAQADVDAISQLVPPPTSIEDARQRLQWNQNRTAAALKEWRAQGSVSVAKPLV